MTTVTLSLISHTNVGKTTLARTLLRRDVGQVLDQAHVTEVSEAHELIAAGEHRLRLWDTPGFGDSARLAARLAKEASPIGWLLHQVWDRMADRPLWCSQEAVRNVREDADVVLYLVNAAEDPADAGYVRPELEILAWIGKPVLVLLNQTGPAGAPAGSEALGRWKRALAEHAVVREVLGLDAFSRCWVQEGTLLERVAGVLDGERRAAVAALTDAWNAQNRAVFDASLRSMAAFLARAAHDREELPQEPGRKDKARAVEALATRLERAERELWDRVIAAHGLEGRAAVELVRRMESYAFEGAAATLDPRKGALVGGLVSGALGGLAADLLSGGLSFGGGLVAGALLGALGGAGLARGFRLVRSGAKPEVRWSGELLDDLRRRTVLRYLAVAHSGRGRGPFEEAEPLERWKDAVERAFAPREAPSGGGEGASTAALERDLCAGLTRILREAYPEAARRLG